MPNAVIVEGIRTPFIKINTTLKNMPADELCRNVIREVIERSELNTEAVDHVIVGNGAQPPEAPNIARIAALKAGVPRHVPAYTVQRNCASGMQSISDAALLIQSGLADVVIAGGVESMSNIPLFYPRSYQEKLTGISRAKSVLEKVRTAAKFRPGDLRPVIGIETGLTDHFCGLNMGETAENLVREFHISRDAQDQYALRSHQRTTAAWEEGKMQEEVMTLYQSDSQQDIIDRDNGFRPNQSLEALRKLQPYFDPEYGTVTAGNSSQLTDGASAVVVMNAEKAKSLGYNTTFSIRSWGYAGNNPETMGLGPAFATPIALDRAGLSLSDIGRIELNEAFAAVVIANEIAFGSREFAKKNLERSEPIGEINRKILNVNGGAIALGHPIGATGNRLVLTLMNEMKRQDIQFGLATACIGGGQGAAMIIERLK